MAPVSYKGVLVRKPHNFHENLRKLSGYLGFETTGDARHWIYESEIATPLIEQFLASFKNAFGLTGVSCHKDKMATNNRIMVFAVDKVTCEVLDKYTSIKDIPIDKDVAAMSYAFTIRQVIIKDTKVFPDGLTPENIHKMLFVLKYAIKSKKPTGKARSDKAEAVEYYPDESGTPPASPKGNGEAAPQSDLKDLTEQGIGPLVEEADSSDNGAPATTVNSIETIGKELQDHKTKLPYPALSKKEQSELLSFLARPDFDINSKAHPQSRVQNPFFQKAADSEMQQLDIDDEASESIDPNLLDIQSKLNNAGSTPLAYEDACELLELDPQEPRWGKIVLQPWQVTGIAWMIQQEERRIAGGILADDCGLGKTLQYLLLIVKRAERTGPPYLPTLVLTHSHLIDTLFDEAVQRFGSRLRIFLFYSSTGPGGVTDPIRKRHTVTTDEMMGRFENLKDTDPNNALVLYMSSYTTWVRRLTRKLNLSSKENEDLSLDSEEVDPEKAEKDEYEIKSRWPSEYRFARVILDEGHAVKNVRTGVHKAVAAISASHHWFATATPMINKPLDLKGVLALLHQESFEESAPNYNEVASVTDLYAKAEPNEDEDLHLLNPQLFTRLFAGGHLPVESALVAIPRILEKIQLRREFGTVMDLGKQEQVIIGSQIPSYTLMTVDCPMTPLQMSQYVPIHRSLVQDLSAGSADAVTEEQAEEMGGHYDMSTYRRLRHASFCPQLEQLFRATSIKGEGNLASDIRKRQTKPGGGVIWLLSRMMQDVNCPWIPEDRRWISSYMVKMTPKYPSLCAILKQVVFDLDEKIMIIASTTSLPCAN